MMRFRIMEFYKFHKIIKYQSKTEKYSTFATSDNFRTRIGYVVIRCDEGGYFPSKY